jgi:hypothetical protein
MKTILIAALIALSAYLSLGELYRVRSTINHSKIPEKDVYSDNAHWRIYDLSGIYLTWTVDDSMKTGGGYDCGLEKLGIYPSGGKFPALAQRDVTIFDYFTQNAELDKDVVQDTLKKCLNKYAEKRQLVNPGEWSLIVDSVKTDIVDVPDSCVQTVSKECAISPFRRECSDNEQCGGGMIKCMGGVCNSAAQFTLFVVFAIISLAVLF